MSCGRGGSASPTIITFPGSALGQEAEVLHGQLDRFMALHPDIQVVQRRTPDAADQRHQLYVQWLNSHTGRPDILQLDVVWTAEFAAAGWILPLTRFAPPVDSFFPATVEANRYQGQLFALPWFVDVGMLYRRTDLVPTVPTSFAALDSAASRSVAEGRATYGLVWQGARYEGLVTVFLEYLGGFGGRIMSDSGTVLVDSPAGVRALTEMRDEIYRSRVVPPVVLTWHEEQARFAFQNGHAVFMRNWPYAYRLMQDSSQSTVARRFAVSAMPAAVGGAPTAALGGSQLAINAYSKHPMAAYALIAFLTQPAQMLERARVAGQFPTRPALYGDTALTAALPIAPARARSIIVHALPRPVTPVYTQLSEILQVWLHRALTRQVEPAPALHQAAAQMRQLLHRVELDPGGRHGS